MKKITLELTDRQLRVLSNALDAYARLGIGQLRNACENLVPMSSDRDDIRAAEVLYKAVMFPKINLHPDASLGVGSPETPMDSKIARDLNHTLQYELQRPNDNWSVYSNDDLQFSDQPRAKIRVEK